MIGAIGAIVLGGCLIGFAALCYYKFRIPTKGGKQ